MMIWHLASLVCLLMGLGVGVGGAVISDPAYSSESARADAFISALQQERVVQGIATVQREGKIVFAKGYGYAVEVSTHLTFARLMSNSQETKILAHDGD